MHRGREVTTGDCLADVIGERGIGKLEAVPCDGPHKTQIVGVITPTTKAYPKRSALLRLFRDSCYANFRFYTSGEFYAAKDYALSLAEPTLAEWSKQEGFPLCAVSRTDGAPIDGDLKDKFRDLPVLVPFPDYGKCTMKPKNRLYEVVPCDQPHYLEVVSHLNVLRRYSAAEALREAQALCNAGAPGYLGGDPSKTKLRPTYVTPDPKTWETDQAPAILCLVGTGKLTTGSLRERCGSPAPSIRAR